MDEKEIKAEIASKLLSLAKDYQENGNSLRLYKQYIALKDEVAQKAEQTNQAVLKDIVRILMENYNSLFVGRKVKTLKRLARLIEGK